MRVQLQEVRSDYQGFTRLIDLIDRSGDLLFDNLEIDMGATVWLDANMCSPLGAILYKLNRNLNDVSLINLSSPVERILSKNGFLANYGRAKRPDTFGTTIEYQRFEPKDDRYFGAYITTNLVGKGIPQMSEGLLKRFRESIFEVFSNAVIHSETELGIFTCGQSFPNKKRLDFTVTDLGMGIRRRVTQNTGQELTAEEAIDWAMSDRNTTKSGSIPGGLGLKLLRDFIAINQGRLQVVSDRGYWELLGGNTRKMAFPSAFPGTVVNIEINTADANAYCLKSELRPEDIF